MSLPKTLTLREQVKQFQNYLAGIKSRTPLDPRVSWYPWPSLAALDVLDTMLNGDPAALMDLIGRDPVLDVGCGDGDVAFFLETLGVRIDVIDRALTNYNALLGVRALKQQLGSAIRIHVVDLDTRPHLPSSHYGFTVMLGVLYHLKNPFLVLETLARASRYIFLSTRIASLSPDRKRSFGDLPIAYLVEEDELNNDKSNFWIFSEKALRRVLRRSGWDVLHYVTSGPAAESDPVTPKGDVRAFVLAKSRVAAPLCGFRLVRGWHQLEHDTWRWSERAFCVELDSFTPRHPATLRFVFQLPEAVFAKASAVTLSVQINGTELPPAIYTAPGEHEYSGQVPSLDAGVTTVEFRLDRAIAPTDLDQRELGLLVDLSGAAPFELS